MKLTKIRLINWMYFHDVTIKLKGNAAISGMNGSGKTSLIDALQYVLTGSRRMSKFNSAQGDSKRNLESYVRGHVGDRELEYLRPNIAESYVAIEIEEGSKIDVFGISINYEPSRNNSRERRFQFKNIKIEDLEFIKNKSVVPIGELLDKHKNESETFNSIDSYQKALSKKLGLTSDSNYFKLVVSAINRRQIVSVNQFIKGFLLEENKIDIEEAQKLLIEIRKLQAQLYRNENRYQMLKEIRGEYFKYLENENKVINLEDEHNYLSYKYVKKQLDLDNDIIKRNEETINKSKTLIVESEKSLESLKTKVLETTTLRNEKHPDIDKIRNEIEVLTSSLNRYKQDSDKYDTLLDQTLDNLEKIVGFDLEHIKSLKRFRKSNNEHENSVLLNSLSQNIGIHKSNLNIKENELSIERNTLTTEINKTKDEIKELEKGFHKYPDNVVDLINILKREFLRIYNEDIKVKPLAEYLEIESSSEEYRSAIEGYLNTQRHHLIINSEQFNKAARIYDQHKHKIHSVKIVDGQKLKNNFPKENTLSAHVKSTDSTASNYVYGILNNVVIVDNVDELRRHRTSITKSCLLYKNSGISKISPEIYKTPYIGRNSIFIRLKEEKKKLDDLYKKYDKLDNKIKRCNKELELLSSITLIDYSNYTLIKSYSSYNRTSEDLKFKSREYNNIKGDSNYILLTDEINSLNDQIETVEKRIIKDNILVGSLEDENKNIEKRIEDNNIKLKEFEESYNNIESIEIANLNNKYLNVVITRHIQEEVSKSLNSSRSDLKYKAHSLEGDLKNYVMTFQANIIAEIVYIDKFMDEYNNLLSKRIDIKNDLIHYETMYKEVLINKFLNNVEEQIHIVNQTIKKINSNLRNKSFGSDSYKIDVAKSKTVELSYIYDVAVKGNMQTNLENYEESNESLDKVREIISNYLDDNNPLEINDLLDVRNYFEFDVTVRSGNHTKSLMEMLDKQSGGESQVPFYILIAAAFEETMEKRLEPHEKLCIVLFDEAFSNMDGQRVEEMLKFFNELNIQVIISVPGKYDSIVPYVDTTLIVTRENETGEIHEFNDLQRRYS